MALSDTCSDTLHSLAEDLVHYTDWGYGPQQIAHVIDAMYSLATLGSQLDTPPDFVNPNPQLVIHSITIGSILETDDEDKEEGSIAKLKMLAEVSKVHSLLASGLEAIYCEVMTNDDSIIAKINPSVISQLERIRKFQKYAI